MNREKDTKIIIITMVKEKPAEYAYGNLCYGSDLLFPVFVSCARL